MKKFNKNDMVALCLLGLLMFSILSIFLDEDHKKYDDEPVKNQISNTQTNTRDASYGVTGQAGTSVSGSVSPSPSPEA
jgi:hypothetical protein